MFNPDLNPYVSQLDDHKDIIRTIPVEGKPDFSDLIHPIRPLIVDLGCGAGNFLRDYALFRPEYNFVGFELRFKRLVKGAIKLKKRNINNVNLIQARAEDIGLWFPDGCISEIYINFPDPWPKKRHRKHRLMTSDYLKTVYPLLVKGGHLVFKTDHEDYFHAVVALISQQTDFEMCEYSEDLHDSVYNESNIPTEFEMLFKGKGCPVFYIKVKAR